MAMDFPASPTDGQAYGSYEYDGSKGVWKSREESAAVAVTSPTPPESANNGDIWIDTSDGVGYFYYSDGTSSQWIELMSSGVPQLASKADKTYVDSQDLLKANLSGAAFSGDLAIGSSGTYLRADNGIATFVTSNLSKTPLTTRGAVSQSANLQEWQDSSATAKSWIDSAGRFFAVNTSPASTVATSNETGGLTVRSTNSTAAAMSFHVPGIFATNMGVNPDYKFSIGGWSMAANSLTLDGAGRMQIPNQPSFFAYATGGFWASQMWIPNTTVFNNGGHYNTSNGRFTAPVTGKYFFSLNSIGNTSGTTRLYPRINGGQPIPSFHLRTANGGNYGDGSLGWIYHLNANDYVDIWLGEGYVYSDTSGYANWSGFLIG